jgi:hypothetical protein
MNDNSVQNSTAVDASGYVCTVHCALQHVVQRHHLDTLDQFDLKKIGMMGINQNAANTQISYSFLKLDIRQPPMNSVFSTEFSAVF